MLYMLALLIFLVSPLPARAQSLSLLALPATVPPHSAVTVTFSGIATPTGKDWIGLYVAGTRGDDTGLLAWAYAPNCAHVGGQGKSAGACPFTMPATPGLYEFRLFANNGYSKLADSNLVRVGAGELPAVGRVWGRVWHDKDGNQAMTAGEPYIRDPALRCDSSQTLPLAVTIGVAAAPPVNLTPAYCASQFWPHEFPFFDTTVTLPVGQYAVTVTPPAHYVLTTPKTQTVTVDPAAPFAFVWVGVREATGPPPDSSLPVLGDVTATMALLGNPTKARYPDQTDHVFSRNPWMLKAFEGRLYIGSGNANNAPPASNDGPVDIWSFSPTTDTFTVEMANITEEEIQVFRVLGGVLYIPGIDAREGWALGNFYRLEATGWQKYRTVPDGIHVYDMAQLGSRLFVAGGAPQGGLLLVSDDNGLTWQPIRHCDMSDMWCAYARVYSFFSLAGDLYAVSAHAMHLYTGGTEFRKLTLADNPPLQHGTRLQRDTPFLGGTAYLMGSEEDDHHFRPAALMYAQANKAVRPLSLRRAGAIPRDLTVAQDTLFVLQNVPAGDGTYTNVVSATRDLVTWVDVLEFTIAVPGGFARSFEYLDGAFYFGMGTAAAPLATVSGDLWRVYYTTP